MKTYRKEKDRVVIVILVKTIFIAVYLYKDNVRVVILRFLRLYCLGGENPSQSQATTRLFVSLFLPLSKGTSDQRSSNHDLLFIFICTTTLVLIVTTQPLSNHQPASQQPQPASQQPFAFPRPSSTNKPWHAVISP